MKRAPLNFLVSSPPNPCHFPFCACEEISQRLGFRTLLLLPVLPKVGLLWTLNGGRNQKFAKSQGHRWWVVWEQKPFSCPTEVQLCVKDPARVGASVDTLGRRRTQRNPTEKEVNGSPQCGGHFSTIVGGHCSTIVGDTVGVPLSSGFHFSKEGGRGMPLIQPLLRRSVEIQPSVHYGRRCEFLYFCIFVFLYLFIVLRR